MTIQEAYNMGLNIAEDEAFEKLSKALDGFDVGSFNNSKMEELRQKILIKETPVNSFAVDFFMNKTIDESQLTSTELKILELFKFCKRVIPDRPSSKITVGLKDALRSIEVDIIKKDAKLD